MRHLMSPLDFSVEELDKVLNLANDIEKNPEKYAHACDGKIMATLFYEPSTRTRLSFESAMLRLGGKVLGFSSADSSSAAKGESVADTIRVVSCYADICAMRLSERKTGQPYHRSVRRPEIRPHRSLLDRGPGPLHRGQICPHFPGGTSCSRLHQRGRTKSQRP